MRVLAILADGAELEALRAALVQQSYAVDVATDGRAGEDLARRNAYDAVILDLSLPRRSGIDVCIALRETYPQLPILILSNFDNADDTVRGLNAGADDFIAKPFDYSVLLARVRALLRRAHAGREQNSKLTCADLEVDTQAKTVTRGQTPIQLTAREFALLEYLLMRRGRVVSRVDLLEHVWDMPYDPGSNVVDVYINFLRKKVDKPFSDKLIHTVTGMGYVLRSDGGTAAAHDTSLGSTRLAADPGIGE